jgi:hypothetical protein
MSEIKQVPIEEQLLFAWKKGWPEYVVNAIDDYPSIKSLTEKIGEYCKVEPSEVTGHQRCCVGLKNMARYCKYNMPWAAKNLHFINRAFQTLYNEMSAKLRMENIKSQDYKWKKKQ